MSKSKFTIKGPYSPSSDDPGLDTGEGLTEQHHGPACDINNIIKNFTRGTDTDHVMRVEPTYGDFSTGEDFLDAQLRLKQAEESFMQLDARIRKRFDNNPANLLDFVADKGNYDEAVRLGLVTPKPITPVEDKASAAKTTTPVN